jgi:hypothetical protein
MSIICVRLDTQSTACTEFERRTSTERNAEKTDNLFILKFFMKVNITFPVAGSNTSMLSGFLPKWITRLHPACSILAESVFLHAFNQHIPVQISGGRANAVRSKPDPEQCLCKPHVLIQAGS